MQERAERQETKDARVAAAKAEFRDAYRRDLRFALAIYRARLIALGLVGAEIDAVLNSNVVPLGRVA